RPGRLPPLPIPLEISALGPQVIGRTGRRGQADEDQREGDAAVETEAHETLGRDGGPSNGCEENGTGTGVVTGSAGKWSSGYCGLGPRSNQVPCSASTTPELCLRLEPADPYTAGTSSEMVGRKAAPWSSDSPSGGHRG